MNPPSPDGGIWIRTQHRVGRRSRENMIWPQVSLAQLASLLVPDYSVEVIDAIATRMGWPEFADQVRARRPLYYLTQVTAPTLTNDMYGVFLAKSLDAVTMAFGTHVTPLARETLRQFPALDFVLRGEPEMTMDEVLCRLSPCDLVLVEGYKAAPIPKLEVWRAAVGKPLLHPQDSHILAIATDSAGSLPPESSRRLQVMGLEDYDAIATFVSQHARRLAVAD